MTQHIVQILSQNWIDQMSTSKVKTTLWQDMLKIKSTLKEQKKKKDKLIKSLNK